MSSDEYTYTIYIYIVECRYNAVNLNLIQTVQIITILT